MVESLGSQPKGSEFDTHHGYQQKVEKMKKLLLPLLLMLILFSGCGQKKVSITWDAPIDGAPVDHYVLVLNGDGEVKTFEIESTHVTIKVKRGVTYIAIVAGVAANGKQGTFSEPSEPFLVEK